LGEIQFEDQQETIKEGVSNPANDGAGKEKLK
jgi:hypothetical protein